MKYYSSPRISGEVMDCSMPMTMDQHSQCGFDCLYCFAYFQKSINGNSGKTVSPEERMKNITAVNIQKTIEIFTNPESSPFQSYVENKTAFQWGGLSDPFDGFERIKGTGLEILRALRPLNYPICFSTKATWWLKDERYMELFKDNPQWNVKVSIINLDAEKAKIMERGVPTPEERLKAINAIAKLNCGGATLRLRPFIIGYSNQNNEHIKLIKRAGKEGATAVSTEFLCLAGRATKQLKERYKIMSELTGFDMLEYYKQNSSGQGYLRLSYSLKKEIMDAMEKTTKEAGMRFYVSDQHFKQKCHGGSCCGLDEKWNYSRAQITQAIVLAKKNGKVTFDEVYKNKNGDWLNSINYYDANYTLGFNTGNQRKRTELKNFSMLDYVRQHWNDPKSSKSPYRYFNGVMHPVSKDKNGNLIYEYREK